MEESNLKKLRKEITELRKDLNTLAKAMGYLPAVHFPKNIEIEDGKVKEIWKSGTLRELRINQEKNERRNKNATMQKM